jgi:hypothetical protein
MRRIGLALAILLATPAWAQARVHPIAPPGNSGVSQYLETVPTAGGSQPTNTVHPRAGGVVAGGSGGPGSTGGNGGAGAVVTIAPSTRRTLAGQGPDGVAAAALAQATAPRGASSHAVAGGAAAASSAPVASTDDGSSPTASVFKALTGSTGSGGGVGALLPIVLLGSVLAAAGLGLTRRRRPS